jgi:hypothetical protein
MYSICVISWQYSIQLQTIPHLWWLNLMIFYFSMDLWALTPSHINNGLAMIQLTIVWLNNVCQFLHSFSSYVIFDWQWVYQNISHHKWKTICTLYYMHLLDAKSRKCIRLGHIVAIKVNKTELNSFIHWIHVHYFVINIEPIIGNTPLI